MIEANGFQTTSCVSHVFKRHPIASKRRHQMYMRRYTSDMTTSHRVAMALSTSRLEHYIKQRISYGRLQQPNATRSGVSTSELNQKGRAKSVPSLAPVIGRKI